MNPFIMYLLQLIQQSGFDMGGLGTDMYGPNPMDTLNSGNANSMFNQFGQQPFQFNPFPQQFPFSPFSMGGRGLPGREMGYQPPGQGRAVAPSQPMAQPGGQPIGPGRPLMPGRPKINLQPTGEGPVDIPAPTDMPYGGGPVQTPPYIPPRGATPMMSDQYFIEPLPGLKVPINLTGIVPQMPQGLPSRNVPNALGIPRIPGRF